jgi:hypothetical protein
MRQVTFTSAKHGGERDPALELVFLVGFMFALGLVTFTLW